MSLKSKIAYPFKKAFDILKKILNYFGDVIKLLSDSFIRKPIKFLFILFPCFLFEVIIIQNIFGNFIDPFKDTTSLTNIGFAIFISISSVCFSWVKTLNDDEKETKFSLRNCGESSFYCGLLFLLSTSLKYVILSFPYKHKYEMVIATIFICIMCLIMARIALLVPKILRTLLSVLYDRVEKNKRVDVQ